jgi:hypothetical protein
MQTIMQDFRRRRLAWLMAGVVGAALLAASGAARPDDEDNRGRGMREAKKRKPDDVVQSPFRHAPRPIIGALREPLEKLPQIENFKVLAYNPLPHFGGTVARGRNGPTGISGNCFYVGNRLGRRTGTGELFGNAAQPPDNLIVDIADPRNPRVVGEFLTVLGATSRELRTIPDRNTLIVMNFADGAPNSPAVNNYQVFDITDCRSPKLVQTFPIDNGLANPHEFYLWRDPHNTNRHLLYTSIQGGTGSAIEPSLRVYEFMNPPHGSITRVATFTLSPAVPRGAPVDPARFRSDHFNFTNKPTQEGNNTHTMVVSDDGKRVYVSNAQAGYFILNSENLAMNMPGCVADVTTSRDPLVNANPGYCLRLVNPDPSVRIDRGPPYPGLAHSFYPVPGRPYAVTQGERNGTNTCPWTWGEVLDISDEMNMQVVSRYMLPENFPENCRVGGPGDPALLREFSAHQPLVFPNIFFLAWYSGGLRAWDINIPELPMEVGVFVPKPAKQVIERFRDSPDVWMWPHPFLHNGLFYITDENSGLYVLEYRGARADELPKTGTFHSNDNLHMFH